MRIIARTLICVALLSILGCSMSPEKRVEREQQLKQTSEDFVQSAVQKRWADIFKVSDGRFNTTEELRDHLQKPWNPDTTLTDGSIASMAWVDDALAKVKVNWLFQTGSVQSFSSETFVWIWKGGGWKYSGRTLR